MILSRLHRCENTPSRKNRNVSVDKMGKIVKIVEEMGIDETGINLISMGDLDLQVSICLYLSLSVYLHSP